MRSSHVQAQFYPILVTTTIYVVLHELAIIPDSFLFKFFPFTGVEASRLSSGLVL